MNLAITFLLGMTFMISVGGLLLLIWALANDQFGMGQDAAKTIFADGEVGQIEDPATPTRDQQTMQAERHSEGATKHSELSAQAQEEIAERLVYDQSSRLPVLAWITSSLVWLLLASVLGVIASVKLHLPDWLVADAILTFGRIRPAHLNIAAYGWASMAGVGVGIWLIPRLFKTALVGGGFATAGAVVWNIGVGAGVVAILAGYSDGMEWLEIPWQIDISLVIGGALAAVPLLLTLMKRRVQHLYVSTWYLMAALIWFPMLFLTANLPGLFMGTEQAILNWWFAHNVLGLWVTPLALAAAYYLIPKIIGAPIHSYSLSLVGFWALALFYSQVGIHHLIGGPVPTWLVTLSIVASIMMIIPVVSVAINHHMTVAPHWRLLLHSPTLRFVVLGAMMYPLASIQGSIEALRSVNTVTHFTHYTVAHAHLGMYGFYTFVIFGSIYFIAPRLLHWEWPHQWAIVAHFWLVFGGFAVYFWPLTVGGLLQGLAMLDASRPFMDSVAVTQPYLVARSVGGVLMTLGHLIFVTHFFVMMRRGGKARSEPLQLLGGLKKAGAATGVQS